MSPLPDDIDCDKSYYVHLTLMRTGARNCYFINFNYGCEFTAHMPAIYISPK